MNKIKLACGIASLALATQAFALTQTVDSGVISGSFIEGLGGLLPGAITPPSGGTANTVAIPLTVPGFSAASMIYLQSVSYVLEVYSYGDFNFKNLGNSPADHTGEWRQQNGTLVAATVGVSDTVNTSYVGAEFLPLAVGAEAAGRTESFKQTSGGSGGSLAPYSAPVTYTFTPNLNFRSSGSIDPSVPPVFNLNPVVSVGARLIVTYTYTDVPEASTYAAGAFLLAGAGFVVRRRMAAK